MAKTKIPVQGEQISGRALKALYGRYATQVLSDFVRKIDRGKVNTKTRNGRATTRSLPAVYKALKPLPTPEEYNGLQAAKYTSTVADLVSEAYSTIQDLGQQMREWYDNLPENLQGADKGQTLDNTASTLEDMSEPDVPEKAGKITLVYLPGLDNTSRADQASEAASILAAVIEALEDAKTDGEIDKEEVDFVDELISELQNHQNDVESCDFPTMYG